PGTRMSKRVTSPPASASCSVRAVRKTVSPSGMTRRGGARARGGAAQCEPPRRLDEPRLAQRATGRRSIDERAADLLDREGVEAPRPRGLDEAAGRGGEHVLILGEGQRRPAAALQIQHEG